MPYQVNAHVMARTSNSSISSDFEIRMQGEFSKNRMEGVIGNGGPLIDLSTSNGSIRLLKMSAAPTSPARRESARSARPQTARARSRSCG